MSLFINAFLNLSVVTLGRIVKLFLRRYFVSALGKSCIWGIRDLLIVICGDERKEEKKDQF